MSTALDYLTTKCNDIRDLFDQYRAKNKFVSHAVEEDAVLVLSVKGHGYNVVHITGEMKEQIIKLIHDDNIEYAVKLNELNKTLQSTNRVLNSATDSVEIGDAK